ncbi:TraR/DksA C4-type zinc finger protein [Chitinimonas sp. PSY-7]|uniref:TraR/DksA C4-type zinc finger protein n=1 Tax=Chitinimonas sp. PSY-7 TaxID=3459088 RepID=UPI00403FEE75
MSDAIDIANDLTQSRLEGLIASQRAALRQQGTPECVDCDDDIPTARRALCPSATRCVHCQTHHEIRQRQGMGR